MTDSYTEWVEKSHDVIKEYAAIYEHDHRGALYLRPIIAGYMTTPAGIYNGAPVEAKTAKFTDIKAAHADLASQGEILLYQLLFCPGRPVYQTFNHETFEAETVDPFISEPHWLIRYAPL